MDDLGPRLRQLTTTPVGQKRFELEWVLPLEPGLSTHVRLFDLRLSPPSPLALGHGADEADALLDLWAGLKGLSAEADALAVVAGAYHRRTGRFPEPPAPE